MILLISASWVARITGMRQWGVGTWGLQCPEVFCFLKCLHFTLFLKFNSIPYKLWIDNSLFSILKIFLFPLTSFVSADKSRIIWIIIPLYVICHFLYLFSIHFSCLWFSATWLSWIWIWILFKMIIFKVLWVFKFVSIYFTKFKT
jgi:hypothetical protein